MVLRIKCDNKYWVIVTKCEHDITMSTLRNIYLNIDKWYNTHVNDTIQWLHRHTHTHSLNLTTFFLCISINILHSKIHTQHIHTHISLQLDYVCWLTPIVYNNRHMDRVCVCVQKVRIKINSILRQQSSIYQPFCRPDDRQSARIHTHTYTT